ncbi:MAG: SUMF1/EgtB/PvdO family nonheme iron enzyme, partial [Planctomycetota bacterium]|nr:SUMF1/EgtB/PvdO family nonheme iron enzyme [Planctomycetota bacterium]
TQTKFFFGDDPEQLGRYAWVMENSGGKTKDVGRLLPNAFGLFDVHGNVNEHCSDFFDPNYYSVAPQHDPFGRFFIDEQTSFTATRVIRGGCAGDSGDKVNCGARDHLDPAKKGFRTVAGNNTDILVGIRVVAEVIPEFPVFLRQVRTLKGHKNTVRSLVFSEDGRRLVSGSVDGTAKIWLLPPPLYGPDASRSSK